MYSSLLTIFASQVSNLLTLIYPLVDLASAHMKCPENLGHPIKLHVVNNIKHYD